MARLTAVGIAALVSISGPANAWAGGEVCGDGVVQGEEACDLGIGNEVGLACTTRCTIPRCGDGALDVDEACDDGNVVDRDGCSSACEDESRPRWTASFDAGAAGGESFAAVAATPHGPVAVGRSAAQWPASAPIVVGFDDEGRQRFHEQLWSGPGSGAANAVAAIGDDGVIVVGETTSFGPSTYPMVWRYEADGARRYARSLDELGSPATVAAVVAATHERAFVGGTYHAGPGVETGWLGEIDPSDGSLLWSSAIEGGQRVADLALAPDGSLVATGPSRATVSQIWVGAFDPDGTQRWIHTEPALSDYRSDQGTSVAVAADGSIYATGFITTGIDEAGSSLDADIWVGAFDGDGQPRWTRTHAGAGAFVDYGADVVLDAQGHPLVVGAIQTQPLLVSTWWDRDIWLRQYDADGETSWTWTYDGPLQLLDEGGAALWTDEGTLLLVGTSAVSRRGTDGFIAELDAQAGISAPPPRPIPPAPDPPDDPPGERGPHHATLHITFDGGTLKPGDRGSLYEVPCLESAIPYPGIAIDAQAVQSIADRVAAAMSEYAVDVRIDDELPPHLPRTTVMVGGLAEQIGLPDAAAGFACTVDCGDRWSWDFAFAFARDAPTIANNVLHEAAHTWGLDHVVLQDLLMYPLGAAQDATWGSGCTPVSEDTSDPVCLAHHERWCAPGQQDSHAELLAAFGPATVDLVAPLVEILSPASGHELAPGEPLQLELRIEDDDGDPGYRVAVPELQWERVAYRGETELSLALPPGVFTVVVEAIDHAGNESSDSIEVAVGDPPPRIPGGPIPDDDHDPVDDPGADPESTDASDAGCRVAEHATGAWLGLLPLLTTIRRRRTARTPQSNRLL